MDVQPNPPSPALRVCMLGPWQLNVAGKSVPTSSWKSKKALSVFRYLLVHRHSKVHKDTLLNLFWPNDDPKDAAGSLHTTIYFLRRVIQPARGAYEGTSFVQYTSGMYWLEGSESSWIDVDVFHHNYVQGTTYEATNPDRALDYYKQALALYKGDFLDEEAYEDWAEPTRNELRETFIKLSLRTSHLLARNNENVSEAVGVCRAALAKDPYREELHQAIMAHLIRAGRYGEAAAQYRQVTALLLEEFDLPPSPETQSLFFQMQGVDSSKRSTSELAPVESDEQSPYVCDPAVFEAICTIGRRVQKRHGLPIGHITLSIDPIHDNYENMERMMGILQGLLRQSDVICRDGKEVRILLFNTGDIGCGIVERRLVRVLDRTGLSRVRAKIEVFESKDTRTRAVAHQ